MSILLKQAPTQDLINFKNIYFPTDDPEILNIFSSLIGKTYYKKPVAPTKHRRDRNGQTSQQKILEDESK